MGRNLRPLAATQNRSRPPRTLKILGDVGWCLIGLEGLIRRTWEETKSLRRAGVWRRVSGYRRAWWIGCPDRSACESLQTATGSLAGEAPVLGKPQCWGSPSAGAKRPGDQTV